MYSPLSKINDSGWCYDQTDFLKQSLYLADEHFKENRFETN